MPRPRLVVKNGSKTWTRMSGGMPQPVSLTRISMVSTKVSLLAVMAIRPCSGVASAAFSNRFMSTWDKLVSVGTNVGQIARHAVFEVFAAQHGLVLEKAERIGDQAMQADLAEHERSGAGVVHQAVQGGGNALGAGNALLDFLALLGIFGHFQFKFEMGEDAEQRIVDLVGGAQGQLGQGRVFSYSANCA